MLSVLLVKLRPQQRIFHKVSRGPARAHASSVHHYIWRFRIIRQNSADLYRHVSRLVISFLNPFIRICTIVRYSVQLNFPNNSFTCTTRSLGVSPGTLDYFDLHLPKSAESHNIRPVVPESVALIGDVYRLQNLMDSKLCVTAGWMCIACTLMVILLLLPIKVIKYVPLSASLSMAIEYVLWFHLEIFPIRVVGRILECDIQLVPSECPLRAWVRASCLPR